MPNFEPKPLRSRREARDSAVNAARETYQNTAKQKRSQFQTSQAGAASTYRNTVANALKTYVDTVTGANETLTNSLADAQKNLAKGRWDAWLKGSKALVGLDAQSATQTAQSLANARSGLRQKSPIAGCFAMSRSGEVWG